MAALDGSEGPFKLDMTKKPRSADVDLKDIRTDGGTQQRPLDAEAVEEYTARYKDDLEMPPVQIILDNRGEMWLWDGFTRRTAAKAAGKTVLRASIRKGTLEDAVWLSYGANKDHGVRRSAGVVRAILERVLTEEAYKHYSAKAIAEHVGVGQRYVEKIKEELAHGRAKAKVASSALGGGQPAAAQAPAPAASPTKREVTRGGKTYEMNVAGMTGTRKATTPASNGDSHASGNDTASPTPPPEAEKDKAGNALQDPTHRQVFGRIKEIDDEIRKLRAYSTLVRGKVDQKDPLYTWLPIQEFEADISNVMTTLKLARPYALCPVHPDDKMARKDCKWCNGTGFLNEQRYKLAKDAMGKGKQDAPPAAVTAK